MSFVRRPGGHYSGFGGPTRLTSGGLPYTRDPASPRCLWTGCVVHLLFWVRFCVSVRVKWGVCEFRGGKGNVTASGLLRAMC